MGERRLSKDTQQWSAHDRTLTVTTPVAPDVRCGFAHQELSIG
jgi:hypothetical protein